MIKIPVQCKIANLIPSHVKKVLPKHHVDKLTDLPRRHRLHPLYNKYWGFLSLPIFLLLTLLFVLPSFTMVNHIHKKHGLKSMYQIGQWFLL